MSKVCCPACERSHQAAANDCIPSVSPAQSVAVLQCGYVSKELEAAFLGLFAGDELIKGSPRLQSSEAYFIDSGCFATFRIRKDPAKLMSYRLNPMIDLRVAHSNMGKMEWNKPGTPGLGYFFSGEAEMFILTAPGEKMLREAVAERAATAGIATSQMEVPDASMIEYLQSAEPSNGAMQLAVIVMEWSEE